MQSDQLTYRMDLKQLMIKSTIDLKPQARLITGSPCFTVKPCLANRDEYMFYLGSRNLFACGTEKGKLLIADITDGFTNNNLVKTQKEFDSRT